MVADKCHLMMLAIATHAVRTRQEMVNDCTPTYDEHAKRAEVHFAA